MKTNNFWNNLFHKKEVNEYKKQMDLYKKQIHNASYLLESIDATNSLYDLVSIHKNAWKAGFQNRNLAPDRYGMFRCDSILTMTPNQVFLGSAYGLITQPIPFWEEHKEDIYGVNGFGINTSTKVYDIVLTQYKRLLRSNIKKIYEDALANSEFYKKYGY